MWAPLDLVLVLTSRVRLQHPIVLTRRGPRLPTRSRGLYRIGFTPRLIGLLPYEDLKLTIVKPTLTIYVG